MPTKKKAAGTTAKKKKTPSLKKVCRKVVKVTGLKADGTLKKGYKYAPGGRVVKVKAKPAAKKKIAATKTKRKPATKRK